MENIIEPNSIDALLRLVTGRTLFGDFIEGFPYPIQLYAPDGMLIAVNTAFLSEFKLPYPSLIVNKYNILNDPTLERYGVLDQVHEAFEGKPACIKGIPAPVHQIKRWFHLPVEDSELFYLNINAFPLKNDPGELICVAIVYVTQNKVQDRAEIARAKEYMQEHWLEKFDIDAVAKAALMSKAHFERRFKAYTGTTPHAYYVKFKMEKLKEELLNLNYSIEQAFSACGMQYHGHYAHLFKTETGLTPSEYRRLAQQRDLRAAVKADDAHKTV